MSKRGTALELIRIEVAREGRVTREALRYYVENRISRPAFDEACRKGLKVFQAGGKFSRERDQKAHDQARQEATR